MNRSICIVTLLVVTAVLVTGCAVSGTPVAAGTPSPPPVPTEPPVTATMSPTALPPSESPPPPSITPTPTQGEMLPPTPIKFPTPVSPTVVRTVPTSVPPPTPHPPNRLLNSGFEGAAERAGFDTVMVVAEWDPFYCAKPYTSTECRATRHGSGNEPDLKLVRPDFDVIGESARVRRGTQAQMWFCSYQVCRAGVYQTFPTRPGELCEVGAWVQSWSSAAEDADPSESDLKTEDDRANSTWYVRVDPEGGNYAWADGMVNSRSFGYEDGIYDQYARISLTFTATSDSATVFIENMRLWPFKNNYSYVDDAFAYCSKPAEEAPASPLDAGLVIEEFEPVNAGASPGLVPSTDSDAWDGEVIRGSDVIRVGDEFWLYYTGGDEDGEAAIGLATSTDGRTWVRKQNAPVFERGPFTTWDSGKVLQPSVLYDPATGQFQMWYLGNDSSSGKYSMGFGYATSSDGINWTRATTGPVLTHGQPGSWDEERIDGPDVVKVGGTYYLFYAGTGLQPDFERRIGCQTSSDGINWTPCAGNPLLSPRPDIATFEGTEVELPSVVYHDGLWLMAYTGFLGSQGENFKIGMVASFDRVNWERLTYIPIPDWAPFALSQNAPILYFDAETGLLWMWYTENGNGGRFYGTNAKVTLPSQ